MGSYRTHAPCVVWPRPPPAFDPTASKLGGVAMEMAVKMAAGTEAGKTVVEKAVVGKATPSSGRRLLLPVPRRPIHTRLGRPPCLRLRVRGFASTRVCGRAAVEVAVVTAGRMIVGSASNGIEGCGDSAGRGGGGSGGSSGSGAGGGGGGAADGGCR